MKTRTLILALVIIASPAVTYGQLGGLLKKGASKVMNSISKETNKEANRQADSIAAEKARNAANKVIEENNQNNANNQNENQNNQNAGQANQRTGMMGLGKVFGGADIKHNDEYSFDGRIYMQMESYEKKGPGKVDYYIYFSQTNPNAGIEFKTVATEGDKSTPVASVMISDLENKCFMILMDRGDGQKTGIIATIPNDSVMKAKTTGTPSTGTSDGKSASIVKTGRTRVIAGYNCDEYKITEAGKKEYALSWLTKELKINADKRNWSKAGLPSYYSYPGFENSSMLAFEGYDENNKLTAKMETVEINQHYSHKISAAGYTFIKMNLNQMGGNQKK